MIRTRLRSAALASIVLLSACDSSSTGLSAGSAMTITSGVPVTGLSGGASSRSLYRIVVPAGSTRLVVETHGGTGDVDLLIRRNRVPTLVESTCESFNAGNEDGCDITNPSSGDWYILLFTPGDHSFSGATLTATVTTP
jgi:hypothetical protein